MTLRAKPRKRIRIRNPARRRPDTVMDDGEEIHAMGDFKHAVP